MQEAALGPLLEIWMNLRFRLSYDSGHWNSGDNLDATLVMSAIQPAGEPCESRWKVEGRWEERALAADEAELRTAGPEPGTNDHRLPLCEFVGTARQSAKINLPWSIRSKAWLSLRGCSVTPSEWRTASPGAQEVMLPRVPRNYPVVSCLHTKGLNFSRVGLAIIRSLRSGGLLPYQYQLPR